MEARELRIAAEKLKKACSQKLRMVSIWTKITGRI